MSLWQRLLALVGSFCVATMLAQGGLLAVLWQRNALSRQTAQDLLATAHGIPVRDLYDRLLAQHQPAEKEMVSYAELQEARMLASLDLDLRELSADKGSLDLRELAVLLNQEKGRYSVVKDQFDQKWASLQQGSSNSQLRDLQRQIESMQPKAAKDQLLRILDSPDVSRETALNQAVMIFKNLAIDKRRKIVAEFKDSDAPRLQDILRQIRLGIPEIDILRETRDKLQEFRLQE